MSTSNVLADPARTEAVGAVFIDFEYRLNQALEQAEDFMKDGNLIALADARNMLTGASRLLDALERLGKPAPIPELYPLEYPTTEKP